MTEQTKESGTRGRAVGADAETGPSPVEAPTSTALVWERVGILAREALEVSAEARRDRGLSGRLSLTQCGRTDRWSCVLAVGPCSWLGDECATPDAAVASALEVAAGCADGGERFFDRKAGAH